MTLKAGTAKTAPEIGTVPGAVHKSRGTVKDVSGDPKFFPDTAEFLCQILNEY